MINVKDVQKSYGRKEVIHPMSFTIEKGQSIGIIGPNGAGKSTLLKMLATIEKPDSGQISYRKKPYAKVVKKIRKEMAYVPQDIALYEELKVSEQLQYWKRLSMKKGTTDYLNQMIETLGLQKVWNTRIDRLSGGWKRKVNLAVGLLNQPSIILLDEPTAGVDIAARQDMLNWLHQLHEQGVTIIQISHDIDDVTRLSDDLLLVVEGRVGFYGSKEQLPEYTSDILERFPDEADLPSILDYFKQKAAYPYG
ncbi:ABC transporter ATP-binding protein [Pontibacillus halophilus JSM 076056 = DSM 19796]|uniref:ABC transporter ATP-binding protein n=2 Tax=Pontibacillus TaxID=289201 RepID=A0A0A5I4H1_9BACI|nr:ABC transporter ATP-binding protein [Pontibacillus halophilus]KGX90722.1 ABC transporter ATP-binding protein [Pontibacillus halophilus JSM 076056 = DSM 19796]